MDTTPLAATLASLLVGYAFGNFLTADVVARALTRKSAFQTGVGNPGMANIGHELGKGAALVVLAGDILKVVAAWVLCRTLFPGSTELAGNAAALATTLGHNFPVWHRFRGGKGVTTTCSAIILATPAIGITSCLFGLAVVIISGYLCYGAVAITLAYLVGSIFLAVVGVTSPPLVAFALVLCALMFVAHWSAIQAARNGTARRASISTKLRERLDLNG
ncbi:MULTISPECIES: glycerol-3-phosphate acyltransferase [Olsenella]|uniref:glycerol-3-phosphate acyltransferase n=1 Tax=Olsenella TaxID=133925 RepID=UPI000782CD0D|nr:MULTISPECIES: glycerol-3-phosphate acyltransferase [Olsenella]KXB62955.1 putative acyl-phosphate glycerol 3-phosphate acyltransferase [Olsenella sp. DNF00959]